MASKMPASLDANNTRITISMAEQGKCQKPLKCEDEFCNAPVEFVNGYSRTVGDSIVAVDPFFRLGKEYRHSEDCQYNVYGQVTIIARESEGDIFRSLQGNRFELRLLAVTRAIEQLELAEKKQGSRSKISPDTTEKIYVEAEQRLGAYINSAQRVLKVRNACEDNSEIEDVLHLVFDGVRLPWRDFYFEDEDYFRCFSQVDKATVQVPIAIKGTVKENRVAANGKAVINLVRRSRKTDRVDVLDLACFSIWSPDPSAFESYKEKGEILAFGIWKSLGVKENPNSQKNSPIKVFRIHTLCLWPVIKSQIEYRKVEKVKKPICKLAQTHSQSQKKSF
jgi:hypothetical protein